MNKSEVLKTFALRARKRLVGEKMPVSTKIKVIENTDQDFENRVEFLLSQEDVVTNPVQYLMDDKILKTLNDSEKERYLLSTLDKFSSFRAKTENMNNPKNFCM